MKAKALHFLRANARAVRTLCFDLPGYWLGSRSFRFKHLRRSRMQVVWGKRLWTTSLKWEPPILKARVMDGLGEHYGYPRHACYLLVWWKRKGYAFGVLFTVPTPDTQP